MKHFTLPQDGGLISGGLPAEIVHSKEKIFTEICPDPNTASYVIAGRVAEAINAAAREGRTFRLGVSTGTSPVFLYRDLVKRHAAGELSFAGVQIFSIDEYYGREISEFQSRNHFIREELLSKVDIRPENVFIPDMTVQADKINEYNQALNAKALGLDLLILGVGEQGQVGFNEAGSPEFSKTRTVKLSYQSRKRQASRFGDNPEATPMSAITMGISTMMSAKEIIMMAWGEDKADVVKRIVEGDVTSDCPATYFQKHDNITFYADSNSATYLSRVDTPWLVGPCVWTRKLRRKAVVWLCQTVRKPILKLTLKDYLENSLGELVEKFGPYDQINIDVFNDLQHTITGWPGGKPNADDSTRPVASSPFPKTVLIFSPHPDDDVISMGGTFIRLVHQGHNVHVAYETSGDVAVHDDVVLQHLDACRELGFADRQEEVRALVASKRPGVPEPRLLLDMKAAIRRSEARAADRSFGVSDENIHFLNLPFYESGGIAKKPRTQADVDIIKSLIVKIHPDQIYMAGDLADPHGTHRVSTETALEAVEQLEAEGETWLEHANIWLYRGAWMEWEIGRVDMAVPLGPDEVIEKRHAIFRHLSQKDIVPFPGDDPREFWQRAEERTQNTARLYDELGMAEYQAIEVFLKLR